MNSLDSTRDSLNDVREIYIEERSKVIRPEGLARYMNANNLEQFQHLANDTWQHPKGELQSTNQITE